MEPKDTFLTTTCITEWKVESTKLRFVSLCFMSSLCKYKKTWYQCMNLEVKWTITHVIFIFCNIFIGSWCGLFRIMPQGHRHSQSKGLASRWPTLGMPLLNGVISHNNLGGAGYHIKKRHNVFQKWNACWIMCFIRKVMRKVLRLRGENSQFQHTRQHQMLNWEWKFYKA